MEVNKFVDEVLKLLDPYLNFKSMIKVYHNSLELQGEKLDIKGKLHIVGLGKAASFEVKAMLELLQGTSLEKKVGLTLSYTKHDHTVSEGRIVQLEGSHPVVTENNVSQTREFITYLEKIAREDTLLFLLSGGGSALLELPKEGMSFLDLQRKSKELLHSGKNINEMNRVRRNLSQVKDGGLLHFIKTENIFQLVTCDIPNEKLEDVSSGPLMKANDPQSHPMTLKTQSASLLLEKLSRDENYIRGKIYDCSLDELIIDLKKSLPEKGQIHLSGGEAPIVIPSRSGKGGRNSHFVLAMAHELYQTLENRDIHILSIGTDGGDGPTDAAGAYINYKLYSNLNPAEFLSHFDSYSYFDKLGTLIKTGPTKTNVMDLRCIWRE